ncbi:hypothetical protein AGMMS49965_22520 [Bacteroidia bacterium]|nr:hypothetical protein AGMMS49965_22520 [Bacteroidia bacterium]
MEHSINYYMEAIEDPRVQGRCLHLLSDILVTAVCTYLTGGVDYQDMHIFAKERGHLLPEILRLPHGAPSPDTFERVLGSLSQQQCKLVWKLTVKKS